MFWSYVCTHYLDNVIQKQSNEMITPIIVITSIYFLIMSQPDIALDKSAPIIPIIIINVICLLILSFSIFVLFLECKLVEEEDERVRNKGNQELYDLEDLQKNSQNQWEGVSIHYR